MNFRRIFRALLTLFCILYFTPVQSQLFNEQTFKFSKALDLINTYYVDTVNQDKLVEAAIIKMMQSLDPHSSYLTPKEVKDLNEPLQGNFEGVGISFNIFRDTILIISTILGGPSEKLGIMAGDRIIKIDGKNVASIGITNNDVLSKLRGKKGTKVDVSIKRKGIKELLDFTIVRDKIPIYSIDAAYKIDSDIGYIKLDRFSATTNTEFEQAMKKLQADSTGGIKSLILDLADNGGGYLEEAVYLANQFLDDDKLIVYTQGLHNPRMEYKAKAKGLFEKGKLVILIDEGSASASEILAGAIQDWDRGIIVGRRSFGKGLVQRPFYLNDGSMIRLTVARYYTPTGRLIQKPYNNGYEEYEKDLVNRYNNGELNNKDSIHFPDSLKFYTLVDKRPVYGGGGIMPDFFVPIDTSGYSDYYRDMIRKGILNKFVLNYIDNNRHQLKTNYPDFKTYNNNFVISDNILNDLSGFAEKEGLKNNNTQFNFSRNEISRLLKAYIARDLFDTNEFYQIMNQDDPIVKKAIDVIKNWKARKKTLMKKIN